MQGSNAIQVQYAWITTGTKCWIKENDGREEIQIFRKAEVIHYDGAEKGKKIVKVHAEDAAKQTVIEAERDRVFQRSISEEQSYDDMVRMGTMNEPELINNLKRRYSEDVIFTYIGPTLIVVNPYKSLTATFDNTKIAQIQGQLANNFSTFNLDMQKPHVYALSALAYKNLILTKKKQAIVISGESGAGKTENARYSMRFLTQLSNHQNSEQNIEEKILSCNPVLEAFGNAKTIRNDNSSRFGKYVKIQVDLSKQKILGASITKYLLEKSRVINVGQGERNYHIFYHLLSSPDQKFLGRIGLGQKTPNDFEFLGGNQRNHIVESINDRQLFSEILDCFKVMQLSTNLQESIFKILSSILFLGNIQFTDQGFSDNNPCSVVNFDVLQKAAELLGVPVEQLKHALLFKTRALPGGEKIDSPQSSSVCLLCVKALGKALYDNLFNWIVNKLNEIIAPCELQAGGSANNLNPNHSIGLLDIFGFEKFEQNSLEQMCINYTNEHLQQLYIAYVFKNEERIFTEDGLAQYLSNLTYEDNAQILELFDSTSGLYGLLNSACMVSKNDDQYLNDLYKNCGTNYEKIISFPKNIKEQFTLQHTQSPVVYQVKGFTDKNMDTLSDTLRNAITAGSQNEDIKMIFKNGEEGAATNTNNQAQGRFLGVKFKRQMKELMEELRNSDSHFIRCVKPNEVKKKDMIVEGYVLQQIQYLGVLNSIEVRKSTYPQRRNYTEFFKEYQVCDDVAEKAPFPDSARIKQEAQKLIKKTIPNYSDNQILFGTSKVYMKLEFEIQIDALKTAAIIRKRTKHAIRIQSFIRMYFVRRAYLKKIAAYKQANQILKQFVEQKRFYYLLQAVNCIQHSAKMQALAQFGERITQIQRKIELEWAFILLKNRKDVFESQQVDVTEMQTIVEPLNDVINQDQLRGGEEEEEEEEEKDNNTINMNKGLSKLNKTPLNNRPQQDIDFQTQNMNSIHIPEKSPDEMYVNPPDSNEVKDPLITYVLSGKLDEIDISRLRQNVLSPALDKAYRLQEIGDENASMIKENAYLKFFETKLNIRRTFFVKKTTKEILTYKPTKINGGSLLPLNSKEVSLAINHFEEMLLFMKETNTLLLSVNQHFSTTSSPNDGQELRIKTLLKYSIGSSTQLKNEILTQILKQLNNNKNELFTLRLLQYLVVFTYCYKPEEQFVMAVLNFLLQDLIRQWRISPTIISHIEYVIPTLFRCTSYPDERVFLYNKFPLSDLKINALIFQNQIKVPVTLSIGVYFYVDVDPWDSFEHMKVKTMRLLDINDERLVPDLFSFFEVQTHQYEVFEKLLFPSEGVWDVMQTQEVQRKMPGQYDSNSRGGDQQKATFQFMFKPMFMFTTYPNDVVGIAILQSQIYFDVYIGKILIESEEVNIRMLANLMNITVVESIISVMPLRFSEEYTYSIEKRIEAEYEANIKGKKTALESQYEYIQLAKSQAQLLGLQLKVKYCKNQELDPLDYTVQLSPSAMKFIDNETKEEVNSYLFSDITHWFESDDEEFFIIKTKDGIKHILGTPFYLNIKYYIQLANNLIKKQNQAYYNTVAMYQSRQNDKNNKITSNSSNNISNNNKVGSKSNIQQSS